MRMIDESHDEHQVLFASNVAIPSVQYLESW